MSPFICSYRPKLLIFLFQNQITIENDRIKKTDPSISESVTDFENCISIYISVFIVRISWESYHYWERIKKTYRYFISYSPVKSWNDYNKEQINKQWISWLLKGSSKSVKELSVYHQTLSVCLSIFDNLCHCLGTITVILEIYLWFKYKTDIIQVHHPLALI